MHPSFAIICYVFLCELWGSASALGSYRIGPPSREISQKRINQKYQTGECSMLYSYCTWLLSLIVKIQLNLFDSIRDLQIQIFLRSYRTLVNGCPITGDSVVGGGLPITDPLSPSSTAATAAAASNSAAPAPKRHPSFLLSEVEKCHLGLVNQAHSLVYSLRT